MARALRSQRAVVRQELLLRQLDGASIPVSISAVPVQDTERRFSGVTMIVEDTSVRKELERHREEWAAVVAHDLRQPVGTISLAAESLLREKDEWPARQRRAIERIASASRRLGRMILDLTDASQIESKRLSIVRRPVELASLVESVVESLAEVITDREIHISLNARPLVQADPDRIHQVLTNLIVNADKYAQPKTDIHVHVSSNDDVAEILVVNRGKGIPPDELPRLFNRFARTQEAHASRTPGLGLGLYIARGLVEAHGGRLWAESIPGETTTLHVVLPK